jgi:uncharacterized membrane protein YfcA
MYITIIILTGIVAGFLNTIAGGGTLLTVPILMFVGLPSAVANGTNRLALASENIVAVINFRQKGFFDWKLSLLLAIPALLGSIIGANVAIVLPDKIFKATFGIVMIFVIFSMIWDPQKRIKTNNLISRKKGKIVSVVIFFFVGLYGGFIQAGVGIIIIALFRLLTGFELAKINSYKVFIVGIYIFISLFVFIINGKVNWLYGICLSIGNGFGAYLGCRLSIKKGEKWIKVILFAVVIFMSLNLLGIVNLY